MSPSIYQLYARIQPGFRNRRRKLFLERLQPGPSTRVLDVGGFVYDWEGVVPISSPITVLNRERQPTGPIPARYTCVVGDARKMDFADQSFDIAYSNSVIEHLGSYEDQQRFAAEIRRVARRLFVQTPNRWFFMEPHFVVPFIHYLPGSVARPMLRFCSVRALLRRGDNVDLRQLASELRLLSFREMKLLFPDCEIYRETWLGLTKSFVAIRL